MKYRIVAVGKLKEKFWKDACAEYLKRLQPLVSTTVSEVPDVDAQKAGGTLPALGKEAAGILGCIPARCHVVLLDIAGTQRSSEDLAHHLEQLGIQGKSDIAFIIGGSHGVSDDVRLRADETLSFGPATLPHNLARVVLLEQLYRAQKIIRGEPYHK